MTNPTLSPLLGEDLKAVVGMASQLAKYGDLIVGACATQALAYAYMLGNRRDGPRDAILRAGYWVAAFILVFGVGYAFVVYRFAVQEHLLRTRALQPYEVITAADEVTYIRIGAIALIQLLTAGITFAQPDFPWRRMAIRPLAATSPLARVSAER